MGSGFNAEISQFVSVSDCAQGLLRMSGIFSLKSEIDRLL